MPLLYDSFEDFVEKNKSVLNYLNQKHNKPNLVKNQSIGMFKAVWEARQSELDTLSEQIKKEQTERKKEKSLYDLRLSALEVERNKYKEVITFLEKKVGCLEEKFDSNDKEFSVISLEKKEIEKELMELSSNKLKMESFVQSLNQEKISLENEIRSYSDIVSKKNDELDKYKNQLSKAQTLIDKQNKKIVEYKQLITKTKANERVFSIDVERLKEELEKNLSQTQQQNKYIESLKEYIERYKDNSVVLQEQIQKSKSEEKKIRAKYEDMMATVKEVEDKLKLFQNDLNKTNAENQELVIHNRELQIRLLDGKKELAQKSERIDQLGQSIESEKQNRKLLKDEMEKLKMQLLVKQQEVEKANAKAERIFSDKEKLQAELAWMNEMLEGIGNKIKSNAAQSTSSNKAVRHEMNM